MEPLWQRTRELETQISRLSEDNARMEMMLHRELRTLKHPTIENVVVHFKDGDDRLDPYEDLQNIKRYLG